jgi:signal transduction histidine kinase
LFGLIHGSHEWFEMGLIINNRLNNVAEPIWVFYLRLVLLGSSFLMLMLFGTRLIIGPNKPRSQWILLISICMLWFVGLIFVLREPFPSRAHLIAADVYTRYSLAIPAAALATWGLILQSRNFNKSRMRRFSLDMIVAAIAFALYGGIGQLFASPSTIYPSSFLNSEVFLRWVGLPIQSFRALMAIFSAIFIIHSLRAFDEENRKQMQALRESQEIEQKRLQSLRSELLHRTVHAQEMERQRIARELHDETGQVLTALGLGLHGVAQTIPHNQKRAIEQSRQLQVLATNGLADLQRLVSGLHPPQLDELGLLAALRWYTLETTKRFNLPITVTGSVDEAVIPDEIRLTIFRIAQESITNIIRHAEATQVMVILESDGKEIQLNVEDNGKGFKVDRVLDGNETNCLGLLGMIERAKLIGGTCSIFSRPGEGTNVEVRFNLARD